MSNVLGYGATPTREELRTASDLVREIKPRGSPSDRAREAYRLRVVEGLSIREVAAKLGVVRGTAEHWVRDVRQELHGK